MDLSKMCTILLLLALVIIVCRNSSELGIEGYENDLAQDRLLNEIDEDAEDAINIAKEILEQPLSEEVLPELVNPDSVVPDPVVPQPVVPQPVVPQPVVPQPVVPQPQKPDEQGTVPPLLRMKHEGPIQPFDWSISSYASSSDSYGERIPLSMQQEYLTLKSLGELTPDMMNNIERAMVQPNTVQDSQVPGFDPTAQGGLLPNQFTPPSPQYDPQQQQQQPPQQQQAPSSSGVEVHFVYAEWCGHSQRAIPDFKQLVDDSSVTTAAGVPIRFVMTEESDPGMAQFKGKVQGFPTYIAVVKNNDSVISMQELNVSSRTADAIKQAAMEINISEGYGNREVPPRRP